VSSNARKMLPAEVLTHPAVVALIARGTPSSSITPEEVRQASEDAAVEPRHLKALLAHLSSLGISVEIPVTSRAVAAASTRKTATAKAPAKQAAAKQAPAKKAAPAQGCSGQEGRARDQDHGAQDGCDGRRRRGDRRRPGAGDRA